MLSNQKILYQCCPIETFYINVVQSKHFISVLSNRNIFLIYIGNINVVQSKHHFYIYIGNINVVQLRHLFDIHWEYQCCPKLKNRFYQCCPIETSFLYTLGISMFSNWNIFFYIHWEHQRCPKLKNRFYRPLSFSHCVCLSFFVSQICHYLLLSFSHCLSHIVFFTLPFSHCLFHIVYSCSVTPKLCSFGNISVKHLFFLIYRLLSFSRCVCLFLLQMCHCKKQPIHLFIVPVLLPQKHHAAHLTHMQQQSLCSQ